MRSLSLPRSPGICWRYANFLAIEPSFLVGLLVWMWLSSLALMLGEEINAVIRKTRR
jgi:hypothetical protein